MAENGGVNDERIIARVREILVQVDLEKTTGAFGWTGARADAMVGVLRPCVSLTLLF